MIKYKYFVSFKSEMGDGNGVVTMDRTVTEIKDIRAMEKFISENKNAGMVTINNFILLGVEE